MDRRSNPGTAFLAVGTLALFVFATPLAAQQMTISTAKQSSLIIAGGMEDTSTGPGSSADNSATSRDQWPSNQANGGNSPTTDSGNQGDITTHQVDDNFFSNPCQTQPLTDRQLFETAGFIATSIDAFAEIVDGEPSLQTAFSTYDTVYINRGSESGVAVGDRFMALHLDDEKMYHPTHTTNSFFSSKKELLGHRVVVDGILEIREVSSGLAKAEVIRAYNMIDRGFSVVSYSEREIPRFDPDQPIAEKSLSARVINGQLTKIGYASGDVIYLDQGSNSGVEIGDVFSLMDESQVQRKGGTFSDGMPKQVGKARVIGVTDTGSTAYIYASSQSSAIGSQVVYAQNH